MHFYFKVKGLKKNQNKTSSRYDFLVLKIFIGLKVKKRMNSDKF